MSVANDVSEKIEILRQQFVRRMKVDENALRSFADRAHAQSLADTDVQSIRRICHSLCGAAGVFGYPVVANSASQLSAAFASGERNGAPLEGLARALIEKMEIAVANS